MKRFLLAAMAALSLVSGLSAVAQAPAGPSIVIGLADPTSYSKILPLPADGIVHPNSRGMVIFRAELTGKGIYLETISVGRGSAVGFHSPTDHTFIGAGWDVRQVRSGTQAIVRVSANDATGPNTKMVLVTLQK